MSVELLMSMNKFKSSHIIKVAIATLMIFSVLFIMISAEDIKQKNRIKRIDMFYNLPIVKLDGELVNITDSISIFYHNNCILYKLPYTYIREHMGSILKQEVKYNYFIYRNRKAYGYYFDSIKAISYHKMNVDSILSLKAFANFNFYNKKNDSLIEVIKGRENYFLIEKYIPRKMPNHSYPDTIIFYYNDNFKNIDISFSKDLENIKKLKINKVRLINIAKFDTVNNIVLPNREFFFELREVPSFNSGEILSFCKSFEKNFVND